MFDKAFELTMKNLSGEEITDEEKLYVQNRNAKYELVRYIYMEKMNYDGMTLTNFHFTPGEDFTETPIADIIADLMKFNKAFANGDCKEISLEGLEGTSNPFV